MDSWDEQVDDHTYGWVEVEARHDVTSTAHWIRCQLGQAFMVTDSVVRGQIVASMLFSFDFLIGNLPQHES